MRTTKTIALVLAAIMLAAALSACSVNNPNYTVLKVGDMNIGVNAYYNNYNYLAQVYSMYGLYNVSTPEAFKRMQDQVFDNLINNALPVVVAKQNGVTLTEEEEAQVQADFKEQIDQMIAQYASQVDESITDEDAKYAEEEKLFKAALKSGGWNYNTYLKMIEDDVRGAAIGNKYMESLYSGVNVTEEDAKAYYDEQLAAKKAEYAETPAQFYTDYSNAISGSDTVGVLTVPEGYRFCKHILIKKAEEGDTTKNVNQIVEEVKAKLADMKHGESLIREEVTEDDIAAVVSKWTGIPVSRMMQSERQKLLHLEDELHKRVVGQEMAITALADAVRRNRAGLQDAKRPIGSFIFLGTTGVGKTELAKALAEFLFDDESLMTRIDMSEYQERHSVSRLIGAPPGYVGYDEGGQLTEAVRRKPYSVVLLDEIEKAHPDVFNILLQVLDDGRLTDNKGRVVDFKNTIIIMTSNIGAHIIQERLKGIDENNRDEVLDKTNHEVYEMLKQTIRPEFLNRIDEIIMFAPLKKSEIVDIVRLQFNGVKKMLENNGIAIEITDKAVQWLAEAGYDPQFGARPVKRVIQRTLLNDLSKQILAEEVSKDSRIMVDVKDDKIVFENK